MVRRRLRRAHTGNQMRRFSALWCFQTRTSSALSEGTGSTNCEANIHAVSQKMSRVVNNHNGAGNAWCTELTVCRSVSVPPREWQMERAFQTALALLRPEVVFILGDVFDEGKWSSPKNWEEDVCRFQKMFRHPSDTELVVLVGNHDIGFHYEMDWFKLQRFEKAFNTTSTRMVTKKGVNFLLVNSVALHGDGCPICQSVEKQLYTLSRNLNCSLLQNSQSSIIKEFCRDAWTYPPTPPIILQHYPLYRVSDAGCTGRDAAPPEERHLLFREKYDVLSQEASHRLLQWFKPRLVLSGHTHSGCQVLHDNRYTEISVPSFNWRNRNNPSFILGSFSPSGYGLSKCFLPEESTVIALYCSTGASLLLLPLVHCLWIRGLLRCLNFCPISKHRSL